MITEKEELERARLLELQSDHSRWFSQQEFDRLNYLSKKAFEGAGDPGEDTIIIAPTKDMGLVYWKVNAEGDYMHTPISVLRYITELEEEVKTRDTAYRVSGDGVFFKCSNCNYEPGMTGDIDDLLQMDYCPSCGSKFIKE